MIPLLIGLKSVVEIATGVRLVKKLFGFGKEKEMEMFKGKKTFIVAALILISGAAQAFGYAIPEAVWPILGALGLGAVRAGISK